MNSLQFSGQKASSLLSGDSFSEKLRFYFIEEGDFVDEKDERLMYIALRKFDGAVACIITFEKLGAALSRTFCRQDKSIIAIIFYGDASVSRRMEMRSAGTRDNISDA